MSPRAWGLWFSVTSCSLRKVLALVVLVISPGFLDGAEPKMVFSCEASKEMQTWDCLKVMQMFLFQVF